jgi:hypothetical protein
MWTGTQLASSAWHRSNRLATVLDSVRGTGHQQLGHFEKTTIPRLVRAGTIWQHKDDSSGVCVPKT